MHLAAAVGLPCVALFSARDEAGKWEPMGNPIGSPHHVLRKQVPCAGCMLVRCEAQDRLCLRLIAVDEVLEAAESVLQFRAAKVAAA
jgi:ADP-heptose:LPS heptosyltransferase